MNKTLLIIIIIIVVVIVGGGIVYYMQQPNYAQNYQPNAGSNPENTQPAQPSNNTSPATYNATIQNFAFSPVLLTIKAGDTVTWTNKDSAPHQVAGSGFQSGVLGNGQSFSFTFNTAGTYDYICNIHTYMKAKIIVQ